MEEAVEFEFSLRIAGLMLIPRDRAKVQRAVAAIGTVLSQDLSHAADG